MQESSVSSQDIRQHLARYLAGDISLHEFDDWFARATWDSDEQGSGPAQEDARALAHTIEGRLGEFTDGHWTEDELKGLLAPLVENYRVVLSPERCVVSSLSRIVTGSLTVGGPSSAAGTQAAVVFA
jgi:hypothetical protein